MAAICAPEKQQRNGRAGRGRRLQSHTADPRIGRSRSAEVSDRHPIKPGGHREQRTVHTAQRRCHRGQHPHRQKVHGDGREHASQPERRTDRHVGGFRGQRNNHAHDRHQHQCDRRAPCHDHRRHADLHRLCAGPRQLHQHDRPSRRHHRERHQTCRQGGLHQHQRCDRHLHHWNDHGQSKCQSDHDRRDQRGADRKVQHDGGRSEHHRHEGHNPRPAQ